MEIEFGELESIIVDLEREDLRVQNAASKIIRSRGLGMEANMKKFAPVDTGNLRNSIGMDQIDRHTVEVGPSADYGRWVEVGTADTAPQPFVGPAFDIAAADLVADLAGLIDAEE